MQNLKVQTSSWIMALAMTFGVVSTSASAYADGSAARDQDITAQKTAVAVPDRAHFDAATAPKQPAYKMPTRLDPADIELYKEIFSLQEDGQWRQADRLIKQIKDDILMGYVLFQRYMHPTKYRSKFSELSDWMRHYADYPSAARVYRLARHRQGKARSPKRPVSQYLKYTGEQKETKTEEAPKPDTPRRSRADQKLVSTFKSRIRREMSRGRPERAEKRLWAFERQDLLSDAEFDITLGQIAKSYYLEGEDDKAFALGTLGAERSRKYFTEADWYAGLAAWRTGNFEQAARHFAYVADSPQLDEWMQAAGAFWAARSFTILQQPAKSLGYLELAAKNQRTFYGIIASKQLGIKLNYDWSLPELSKSDEKKLEKYDAVQRAIALKQVGNITEADRELRVFWGREGRRYGKALIAMAAHLNLPSAQLILYKRANGQYDLPESVQYPLPDWKPANGFQVDKALMFSWMHQESNFMAGAHSRAGAYGLMQLTPATASFIMNDRSLRRNRKKELLKPEFNMQVSQRYMKHLLDSDPSGANFLWFAASYNAGPGNFIRWEWQSRHGGDPFLFIESITAWETRNHIERVFANMWIYRDRLGQAAPSLDAIASGAWPIYEGIDNLKLKRNSEKALTAEE